MTKRKDAYTSEEWEKILTRQRAKRKADCTPEEWERRQARRREYDRKYLQQPRVRERLQHPETRQRRREQAKHKYHHPGFRERERARAREYSQKPEVREAQRNYKQRPAVRERHRELEMQRRLGIAPGTRDLLAAYQRNACAICISPFTKTPHMDHCHDTGTVRGLLCGRCNTAEGYIKSLGIPPEEFGKKLAEYLANPPAKQIQDLLE